MTWKGRALALFTAIALAAGPVHAEWERWPAADRLFVDAGRWTGADAAYTVDLGRERVLWLFGDTFVGAVRGGKREGVTMVRNTVGIQRGRDPATARIRFYMGRGAPGIFAPPGGRGWLWPLHGARTPAGLAIFLGHFEETSGGGAFGFRSCGNALALIANADDAPGDWRIRYVDLPFGRYEPGHQRAFGIAVTPHRASLYVWGYRDRPHRGTVERAAVLARAPLAAPERTDRWRFWDGARWVADPAACAPLFDECATELSVHGAGPGGGAPYLAMYTRSGLSPDVLVRTASRPEGPWSAAQVVYRCPEAGPGVFTYAAKAHPELSGRQGEVVATYLTNSGDLGRIVNDARLYRPLFLRGPAPRRGLRPARPGRGGPDR